MIWYIIYTGLFSCYVLKYNGDQFHTPTPVNDSYSSDELQEYGSGNYVDDHFGDFYTDTETDTNTNTDTDINSDSDESYNNQEESLRHQQGLLVTML